MAAAKDSDFLKDYSDEDPIKVSQLQEKIDRLDESTICHKVLKPFASELAKIDTGGEPSFLLLS